jgi:hypothetical protein
MVHGDLSRLWQKRHDLSEFPEHETKQTLRQNITPSGQTKWSLSILELSSQGLPNLTAARALPERLKASQPQYIPTSCLSRLCYKKK